MAPITTSNRNSPSTFADGWLVVVVYFAIFSWSRWISPGGFAGFYRRTGGTVRGRTWLQDFMHLGWVAFAVGTLFLLAPTASRSMGLLMLSLACFRIADLLVDVSMLAVFGNRYGRSWQGAMPPRRLHRTLLIDLILFVELIFWNAVLALLASRIDPALYADQIDSVARALHLSVATATTIGYGTYAPVKTLSVTIASVQAVSTLLLLSGVIAGVFSRSTSIAPGTPDPQTHAVPFSEDTYGLVVLWDDGLGWGLRWVLPIVIPSAIVLGCWQLALGTDWLR